MAISPAPLSSFWAVRSLPMLSLIVRISPESVVNSLRSDCSCLLWSSVKSGSALPAP